MTQEEAFRLEDIVAAKNSSDSKRLRKIHWTATDKDSSHNEYVWQVRTTYIHSYTYTVGASMQLQCMYVCTLKVVVKPALLRVAALLCGVLSVLSILGAVCSVDGVSIQYSVYFIAVHRAAASPSDVRTHTYPYTHTLFAIHTNPFR